MTRKEKSALNKLNHRKAKDLIAGRIKQNETDFNRAHGFRAMTLKTENNKAIKRMTTLDGDGLIDKRNLRGDRINVGGLRADSDMERAEFWAAHDVTFHYNILVVSNEPEQETSALRNFARLPEGQKKWKKHFAPAMKDQKGSEQGCFGMSRSRTL